MAAPSDHRRKEGSALAIGAFGKHPGWEDHPDDPVVADQSTPELKAVCEIFHTRVYSKLIDEGVWAKLPAAQRLDKVDAVFLRRVPAGWSVGRIWPSTDTSGRDQYPMIVCADTKRLDLGYASSSVMSLVMETAKKIGAIGDAARAAYKQDKESNSSSFDRQSTQNQVRSVLMAAREGSAGSGSASASAGEPQLRELIRAARESTVRDGIYRVFYRIEKDLVSHFRTPKTGFAFARRTAVMGAAKQFRVPLFAPDSSLSVVRWASLLDVLLEPDAELTIIAPLGASYIDVIVGTPDPDALQCLRINAQGMPPESDVPYSGIDEAFRARTDQRLEALASGAAQPALAPKPKTATVSTTPAKPSEQERPARAVERPAKSSPKLKWLLGGGGGGAVLLVVAILLMRSGGESDDPKKQAMQVAKSGQSEPTVVPPPSATEVPPPVTTEPVKVAAVNEKKDPAPANPPASSPPPSTKPPVPQPPPPVPASPSSTSPTSDPRSAWTLPKQVERLGDRMSAAMEVLPDGSEEGKAAAAAIASSHATVRRIESMPAGDPGAVGRAISEAQTELDRALPLVSRAEEIARSSWQNLLRDLRSRSVPEGSAAQAWARVVGEAEKSGQAGGVRASLRQWQEALDAMSKAAPVVSVPRRFESVESRVQAAWRRRVEEARSQLLKPATATLDHPPRHEEVTSTVDELAHSAKELSTALSDAETVASALEEGLRPDEATATGLPLAVLGERLASGTKAIQSVDAGSIVTPITARLASLMALAREGDAARLMSAVMTAPEQLAESRTAWKRLTDIPQRVEALEAVVTAGARLKEAGRGAKSERAAGVQSEVASGLRGAWLSASVSLAAPEQAQLEKLLDSMNAHGVRRDDPEIAAALRYNLALLEARRVLTSAPTDDGAVDRALVAVRAAAAGLNDDAVLRALGGQSQTPAAKPVSQETYFAGVGPGRAGWKPVDIDPTGATVAYERSGTRIVFARLGDSGGAPVYLSTREVSFGVFAAVLELNRDTGTILGRLRDVDSNGIDRRRGLRVWQRNSNGTGLEIARADASTNAAWWFPTTDVSKLQGLAAPGTDTPVQYLSAGVCVRFAALVGCRLQTVAEWKRAWAMEAASGAQAWNLRDKSWLEFPGRKLAGAPSGNDGAFRATGPAKQGIIELGEEQLYSEATDGVAYFAPVGEGPGRLFKHLAGNVAEWAIGDSKDMDAALQREEPVAAAEQFKRESVTLHVIGGSAISPCNVEPDRALGANWTSLVGCSDVGIRLAFTAGQAAATSAKGTPARDVIGALPWIPTIAK